MLRQEEEEELWVARLRPWQRTLLASGVVKVVMVVAVAWALAAAVHWSSSRRARAAGSTRGGRTVTRPRSGRMRGPCCRALGGLPRAGLRMGGMWAGPGAALVLVLVLVLVCLPWVPERGPPPVPRLAATGVGPWAPLGVWGGGAG